MVSIACQRNSIRTEIGWTTGKYVPLLVICGCMMKLNESENTPANLSLPPTLLRLLFPVN